MGEPEARACHYCGCSPPGEGEPFDGDRELRPYGPGGSWVCHPCAFATPERRAQTEAAFDALLGSAAAVSPHGVAVIGQETGPQPLDLDNLP